MGRAWERPGRGRPTAQRPIRMGAPQRGGVGRVREQAQEASGQQLARGGGGCPHVHRGVAFPTSPAAREDQHSSSSG